MMIKERVLKGKAVKVGTVAVPAGSLFPEDAITGVVERLTEELAEQFSDYETEDVDVKLHLHIRENCLKDAFGNALLDMNIWVSLHDELCKVDEYTVMVSVIVYEKESA